MLSRSIMEVRVVMAVRRRGFFQKIFSMFSSFYVVSHVAFLIKKNNKAVVKVVL